MSEVEVLPEVKEILGAMLFASKIPVSPGQMRKVLKQVGEDRGGAYADFATLKESEIKKVMEDFKRELEQRGIGITITEVAGGYRFENIVRCGPWIRQLLERGKPQRLSRPALETLAIVAYRQPCVRSEIEAVRGVACDQVLRKLMELQLVKIVGRSDLPGRPMLFGSTHKFLEYFGIRHLDDLPGVSELARMTEEGNKAKGASRKDAEEHTAVQGELLVEVSETPHVDKVEVEKVDESEPVFEPDDDDNADEDEEK